MREVVQMVLQLVRYANQNNLNVNPVLPELMARLQVTSKELDEIAEILKADLRELRQVNERLRRMGPENPDRD